jgi:hypothetical protein
VLFRSDEFAKDMGAYQSLDDLKERIRADLKPGQLQQLLRDEPPALLPADVIAVSERHVARAKKYLDLTGMEYQSVGHRRLYHVQ